MTAHLSVVPGSLNRCRNSYLRNFASWRSSSTAY